VTDSDLVFEMAREETEHFEEFIEGRLEGLLEKTRAGLQEVERASDPYSEMEKNHNYFRQQLMRTQQHTPDQFSKWGGPQRSATPEQNGYQEVYTTSGSMSQYFSQSNPQLGFYPQQAYPSMAYLPPQQPVVFVPVPQIAYGRQVPMVSFAGGQPPLYYGGGWADPQQPTPNFRKRT